jgi:DNA-binding winged helix-turn-helix (wHTH) protein/TolB-like protein
VVRVSTSFGDDDVVRVSADFHSIVLTFSFPFTSSDSGSMTQTDQEILEFDGFRLNIAERVLTRLDGEPIPQLSEKPFQTLCVLIENRGRLISKAELMEFVWADAFVEENNLDKAIHVLRNVLGERPGENRFIETVRKHGYRFVASVEPIATDLPMHHYGADKVSREPGRSPLAWHTVVALSALIFALAAGFYMYASRPATAARQQVLAVLPIRAIAQSQQDTIRENGITDSLILKLSSIKGLIVRQYGSVKKYAGQDQDPVAVGLEQNADIVLSCSYQISDGKIQVSAQLHEVGTGDSIYTFKVIEETSDVFAMQDAIARDISRALIRQIGLEAGTLAKKRGTDDPEAYGYFLKALDFGGRQASDTEKQSVEYLEEAISLDPQFARAYAALARSRIDLSNMVDSPSDDCAKAKAAADRALGLEPTASESHHAVGLFKNRCEWDFAGAEAELRRSVEIDPNSGPAQASYALYLSSLGRHDEALRAIDLAFDLDPASRSNQVKRGTILYLARRYDEAIAAFGKVESLGKMGMAAGWVFTAYALKGDEANAFAWFLKYDAEKQLKPDPVRAERWNSLFKQKGWRGIIEAQLAEESSSPVYVKGRFYRLARCSAVLGNTDAAFAYIDKALERRDAQLLLLKSEPTFDPIRSDPRFNVALQKIGFPNDSSAKTGGNF